DVCISSNSITLTGGTPTGGTYSGPGVSGTQFDPSVAGVGTHVITYSVTNSNGCTDSDTTSITVNPLPTVSFTSPGTFCESDAAITLTGGSPTGGTYSGTGVTGGQFDPSAAGTGTYSLVYTYSDPNGCSDTAMTTVTVNPTPQVTLPSLTDRCIDAGVVTLPAGSPSGGTYSGPGVTGNQFDPSVAGVGTHNIVYSFTSTNGCTGSDTQQVEVNPLPTVNLDLDTSLCESADTLLLSGGTPQGGVFSGNGVTGNTFNISQAGLGTTVVQYEFTDSNGCLNSDSGTVEVLSNPSVSLGSDIDICEGLQDTLVATGASTYTWSTGSQTNSIIVSPMNDTSYSVVGEGSNGCLGSDTIDVTVLESPQVELNEIDTVCADTVFSIDAGSGYSSYLWNNGETTQSIDVGPFVQDTGYSYVVVVQNSAGCSGIDTVSFAVIDCDPSGIITEDPRSVRLYPNPSNGVFTVESEDWYGDAKVEVISSTGVLVHKSNISDQSYWKKRFDLSEASNGVYFFTIKTPTKVFQKRIIINR
ncbi:T9SS type A sorting domain-containing protein, partial [Salibacter halophilus]